VILYRTLGQKFLRPILQALYKVDGTGWERIPASGPAIIAGNHESQVDPFIMGMATPRVVHYMAKIELWRNPIVGKLMDGFGAFPVKRGTADEGALDYAIAMLGRGELVGMFPQGTSIPHRRRPWRSGAARLAKTADVPLVPICIVNTEKVWRPKRFKMGLPKVWIHVAEPIDSDFGTAGQITQEARRRVEELREPYGPPAHLWLDD
jgi:1-acyl-sn-glycerol-3-phosphate acyltransferase